MARNRRAAARERVAKEELPPDYYRGVEKTSTQVVMDNGIYAAPFNEWFKYIDAREKQHQYSHPCIFLLLFNAQRANARNKRKQLLPKYLTSSATPHDATNEPQETMAV